MIETTQKALRQLVSTTRAIDITYADVKTHDSIIAEEGYLDTIAISYGVYGCNGKLFHGCKTGRLYAITSRTNAVFLF